MTLKLTVKTLMHPGTDCMPRLCPSPSIGINGSGMHINMSLFKDGKNAFYR